MVMRKNLLRLLTLTTATIAMMPLGSLMATSYNMVGNVNYGMAKYVDASTLNGSKPALYIAADTITGGDTAKTFALARATLGTDANGTPTVIINAMAPNAETLVNAKKIPQSPLFDKKIAAMTTYAGMPIVTPVGDPTVYGAIKTDGSALITNDDGATVQVTIHDANGTNDAQEIKSIAGGDITIGTDKKQIGMAAVSANGSAWQDATGTDRGIAVFMTDDYVDPTQLVVYDATNFAQTGNNNKAIKLDLTAKADNLGSHNPVSFYKNSATNHIATAELGPDVDMFWHQSINRLYVGLNNVHRDNPAQDGGVIGLFMGRIDTSAHTDGELKLQSVVDYQSTGLATLFESGKADHIIGFYAPETNHDPLNVSIKKITSLHTSTGHDYLIVVSAINGSSEKGIVEGIFALPLLTDATNTGTISKVNTDGVAQWAVPTTATEMPRATQPAVKVCNVDVDNVADIFTKYDTVYFCYNGNTNATAGLFACTALFDVDGNIIGWTPAQRVMGQVGRVVGAGLDLETALFYALTSEEPVRYAHPDIDPIDAKFLQNTNAVQISDWGKTDDVRAHAFGDVRFDNIIEKHFPANKGGVVGMFNFDQYTPGFDHRHLFSMTVILGPNKVALIQTGNSLGGHFEVADYFTDDPTDTNSYQNVFIYQGEDASAANYSPALANIAPLTYAEVSRSTNPDFGWLFVGGYNGVAVLSCNVVGDMLADDSKSPVGRGWWSARGLSNLDVADANFQAFPGGKTGDNQWTFKQLSLDNTKAGKEAHNFKHTRKMSSDGERLYVLTNNALYYFEMGISKFAKDTSDASKTTGNINQEKVSSTNPANEFNSISVFSDMLYFAGAHPFGIVATDKGIFAVKGGNPVTDTVKVADSIADFITQLQVLGNNHGEFASNKGNVYGLTADFKNYHDSVWRLLADATQAFGADSVKVIKVSGAETKFKDLQATRQDIDADGTYVYATLPKHYDQNEYLTLHRQSENTSIDMTAALDVDINTQKWVTGVKRMGDSGAVTVPGDFGVRVNN
jgi:hypothetical protein